MPRGWVFLRVNGSFEVAVPQDKVFRILHRSSEEYHQYAPSALALHRRFALEVDTSLPGVLVVLNSGACWHAGDASHGEDSALAYLTISPDLFGGAKPWCRGILWGPRRAVYILDEERMEAAVA